MSGRRKLSSFRCLRWRTALKLICWHRDGSFGFLVPGVGFWDHDGGEWCNWKENNLVWGSGGVFFSFSFLWGSVISHLVFPEENSCHFLLSYLLVWANLVSPRFWLGSWLNPGMCVCVCVWSNNWENAYCFALGVCKIEQSTGAQCLVGICAPNAAPRMASLHIAALGSWGLLAVLCVRPTEWHGEITESQNWLG